MKKQVYAYLHTHWDREWYRDKEDFNLRFLEVFDIVLDELKNSRAPFFYLDGQVLALLDYLKYKPEKTDEIKELILNKKLFTGPFFVSADSYLVNFNSMLKNLEIGINYAKSFNQKEFIGYLSDIFGVSGSIFEALKLNNIDKSVIWRGVNPKKINSNCNFTFKDVKTSWLVQGYFNDFFHSDPINFKGIKNYLDKISKYSDTPLLVPIGADHLAILKDANNKIKEVNKNLEDYEIKLINPFEYFKKHKFENQTKEKEFLDNSDTYILGGVYSTRIHQKIKNVILENDLSRIVEPLNFYLKDKYDSVINETWKTLIKNHAHDSIYGCSLDSVANNVDYRFLKVENTLASLKRNLIGNFKKKHFIKGKSKDKIGLFNLTNNDNLSVVKITLPYVLNNSQVISKTNAFCDEYLYNPYKIPVTEEITPIYTQLIQIDKNKSFSFNTVKILKPKKETKVSKIALENNNIKFEIKNKKFFVTNKKTNDCFEFKLTDILDKGDSYNFAPKGSYKTLEVKKTEVLYDGIIESAIKLDFSSVSLILKLRNNSEFLNFDIKINNKKKNHKLQLAILTNSDITKTIAQDAIGTIERKIDPNYSLLENMPAPYPKELKTNSYPMQSFVCANNIIALTKGLQEYEIYKNELRICLLRAVGTISNPKNKARAIPAGPDLKTPKMQCLEPFEENLALTFGSKKKAFKLVDEFFENYLTFDGDFNNKNKDLNIKFTETGKNSFIYGIYKNKKISYNIQEEKVELI